VAWLAALAVPVLTDFCLQLVALAVLALPEVKLRTEIKSSILQEDFPVVHKVILAV
jgi:hypothetical protein